MGRVGRWLETPRGEFWMIAAVIVIPMLVLVGLLAEQMLETNHLSAERMVFVEGEFVALEEKDSSRGNHYWVLELDGERTFQVSSVINFSENDFRKQVSYGDAVILGVIDESIFEIQVNGEMLHSFATSLRGRQENDAGLCWFLPIMMLLVAAALWITAVERYHFPLPKRVRRLCKR